MGGLHPASANGFATLAALQAVYSFATALSNDMAGLMIQAAVNYADAHKYRTVLLDAGTYRNIPTGIVMPAFTGTRLVGAGRAFTAILCSPCGTNPGITIQGASGNAYGPVQDISFWGFDTKSFGDPTTGPNGATAGNTRGGAKDSMLYNAGSVGISLSNCNYLTFRGLGFQNFDRCTVFTNTGNNYLISFDECVFELSNVGYGLETYSATNSYEKMSCRNCLFANNNIGVYVLFSDGGSNGVAADLTFYDCSIDYNIQYSIYYTGAQNTINTRQNCLRVIGGHIETNSATSGTAADSRIHNAGDLHLFNVEFQEAGDLPPCAVYHGGFYSATDVTLCRQSNRAYPWVNIYNTAGYVTGGRNNGGPLALSSSGTLYTESSAPSTRTLTGNVTFPSNYPNDGKGGALLVTGNAGITIPIDDANFNYMTNTGFTFRTTPNSTGSFVPASGVTISSSGAGLTFGGAKPAEVHLTKVGPSAWIATGQMT